MVQRVLWQTAETLKYEEFMQICRNFDSSPHFHFLLCIQNVPGKDINIRLVGYNPPFTATKTTKHFGISL